MKKLTKLLFGFLVFTLAFTIVFAVACSGGCSGCNGEPKEPEVTVTDSQLIIDTSDVKTLYVTGEDFTSAGLTAKLENTKSDGTTSEEDVTEAVTVDSSAFNKEVAGTYLITVNYSVEDITASASFNVTVITPRNGLAVSLKSNVSNTIELDEDLHDADLSGFADMIEVRRTDKYGAVLNDLITGYEAKLYLGQTEQTSAEALPAGAYNIWVTFADTENDLTLEGFVIVYVVNNVVSLSWNETTAETQQVLGDDEITPTWVFTATYANGDTKVVTDKVAYDPKVDTETEGQTTTQVSYTEVNAKGESKTVTLADGISYTIDPRPVPTGRITYTVTYKAIEGGWQTTWASSSSDAHLQRDYDNTVTVGHTGDNSTAPVTKTFTDEDTPANNRTFSYQADIKTSRYGTVSVKKGALDVKLVIYAWATSASNAASRHMYVGTELGTDSALPDASTRVWTADWSDGNVHREEIALTAPGDYVISSNNTSRMAEFSVTYTVDYDVAATKTVKYTFDAAGALVTGGDTTDKVTFTTVKTIETKASEKQTADGTITLKDAITVKELGGQKQLKVAIASGLASAKITVIASHTSGETRTLTIANANTEKATDKSSFKIGNPDPSDPTVLDRNKLQVLTFTATPGETYDIYTEKDGDSTKAIYVYEVDVTITEAAEPTSFEANPNDLIPAGTPVGLGKQQSPDLNLTGDTNWGDYIVLHGNTSDATKLNLDDKPANTTVTGADGNTKQVAISRLELKTSGSVEIKISGAAKIIVSARVAGDGTGRGLALYSGTTVADDKLISPAYNARAGKEATAFDFGTELINSAENREMHISAEQVTAADGVFTLKAYSDTICIMYITVIYD